MEDAEFRAGAIEIQWLERRLDSLVRAQAARRRRRTAAALVARADRRSRPTRAAADAVARGSARVDASRRDAWTQAARLEGLR